MADDATEPAKAPKEEDKAKSKDKGKDGSPKKKGKQAGSGDAQGGAGQLSIAAHPRAARRVTEAKGWGGLIGFVLGGYLSLPTNTLADAGLHALAAGAACYVVVWGGAVFLWRHLVVAELRNRQHELLQAELERLGFPTNASGASMPGAGSVPSGARTPGSTERMRAGAPLQ